MLDFDQIDNADLSREMTEARRVMRAELLKLNNPALFALMYKALTLSEHEAARRARSEVLERCHLSNSAEA